MPFLRDFSRSRALCGLASVALLLSGAVLARRVEPGVRVETVQIGPLAAIRIGPAARHAGAPRALLAHGFSASKEAMFRLGEALAAAGFECLAFDFSGHGESPAGDPPDRLGELRRAAKALAPERAGGPEVLAGHSMGAYTSGAAMARAELAPRALLSMGALPNLGDNDAPELLLVGAYDELISPSDIRAQARERTQTRAVVSPYSDHVLEPFDPLMLGEAVRTACASVGLAAPRSPPTAWLWRLLGCVLLLAGAVLGLGAVLQPAPGASRAWASGALAAVALIGAAHVALGQAWLGTAPVAARLPRQVLAAGVLAIGSWMAGRIAGVLVRAPRLAAALGQGSMALALLALGLLLRLLGASFMGMACGIGAALLLAVAALASGAGWRVGRAEAAHAAFGVMLGWALFQWVPLG